MYILSQEQYAEDQEMRTVDMNLVERLKNERASNLQRRAADYLATEPDHLSQRFREVCRDYGTAPRYLTWRGQQVKVYGTCESEGRNRYYSIDGIFDQEWVSVADEVTSSEMDDLERQLFNLDNLARCGL